LIRNYDYGKILILDDFELFHQGLVIVLESARHQVIESVLGAAAIDVSNRECPDLIIMDSGLPVKTGWEVIEELKSRDDTQGIRIVALSGDVS
jgi:CheY-like chemotaxis protein